MKIISSFTHCHAMQNLYALLSSVYSSIQEDILMVQLKGSVVPKNQNGKNQHKINTYTGASQ